MGTLESPLSYVFLHITFMVKGPPAFREKDNYVCLDFDEK